MDVEQQSIKQNLSSKIDQNCFNSDISNCQKSPSKEKSKMMDITTMTSIIFGMKKSDETCLQNCLEMMTFADDQLKMLAESMNSLHAENIDAIILPDEPITDAGVYHLTGIPWLKDLSLGGCLEVTDRGVKMIGEKLKNLECLSLCSCDLTNVTPLKNLKNLKRLDIRWTGVNYIDIDWIKNSNLIYLDVRDTLISDDDQEEIAKILEGKNKLQQASL